MKVFRKTWPRPKQSERALRKARLLLQLLEARDLPSTYYVAPTGSNSAAGSAAAPWQTLQQAANTVQAGDTVHVAAGNYLGFNIVTGGTAAAPITFQADAGTVINQPMYWGGIYFGINNSGHAYNVVDGFTMVAQPSDPLWDAGIRFGGTGTPGQWVQGGIIRNNIVHMRVVTPGDTSQNYDQFDIFTSWQDGTLVQNNTVSGGWDSGIYMSNSAKNYVVQNNTVFNVGGNGIHNNGDLSAGSPGINYNALIEGNIIHDVCFGIGGQAISCDGVQDSRILNNLVYNSHSKGISLFGQDAAQGSQRDIVVNNTVLTAADGGSALRMADNSPGNTVYNNVFYSYNTSAACIDLNSEDLVGLVSDYNVVTNRIYVDGSTVSFSAWKSNYHEDAHSLIATPTQLFANNAANDYHLVAGSPAVDAGTATDAPATDIVGTPRPQGAGYDIGAYELPFAEAVIRVKTDPAFE